MNTRFIRSIYNESFEKYKLELKSYIPITNKSYKVISNNNDKYLIKKTKDKANSKYSFLKNEGVDNIVYPIVNNSDVYSSRINDNLYNEIYCVLPFVDDTYVFNETKAKGLIEELQYLHFKTSFYRKLSIGKSRKKMEEILSYLDYKFNLIESYVRTIEAQPFDEFSIPILKKYKYILESKKVMALYNKKVINAIKEEKSVMYCFLHNNPKIDHLIINSGKKYLISIDNGVIGIPSLDIAKFYIENCDINFDIKTHILDYFTKFNDDFYFDYFVFLVLFIYVKSLIIEKKDYVSTQNFVFVSDSLKMFLNLFDLATLD